jgi:monofunctional biosynthetic peptidoglycan transglycosylase
MLIRCWQQFNDGKKLVLKHSWTDMENISPYLADAIVCSEDQLFAEHEGFDWEAIQRAYYQNKKGKKLVGGSTISQQTAKNVFLWPGRSYLRKGLEGWFTFLIERCWSKKRIMEVYMNSVEMGPGIYGAKAAARYWFGKDCRKLTADEAAAIAAILPSPLKWKANPPSPYVIKRKMWIKKQMELRGKKIINEIDDQ